MVVRKARKIFQEKREEMYHILSLSMSQGKIVRYACNVKRSVGIGMDGLWRNLSTAVCSVCPSGKRMHAVDCA
jgi:hypothetical protein